MKNPVSGEIKEVTIFEFLEMFDESVRPDIMAACARYPDKEGIVCFENLQLDSSHFGDRAALVMGPSNSWPLARIEEDGFRLSDLPSNFKYPVAYVDYRNQVQS